MHSSSAVIDERATFARARSDVNRARRQLDMLGTVAIHTARIHLEIAVASLQPLTADTNVAPERRRVAERCRATLSSHLLAAENLDLAGVPDEAIVELLGRATKAFDDALDVIGIDEPRYGARPTIRR
jgi:hypothetical protein